MITLIINSYANLFLRIINECLVVNIPQVPGSDNFVKDIKRRMTSLFSLGYCEQLTDKDQHKTSDSTALKYESDLK